MPGVVGESAVGKEGEGVYTIGFVLLLSFELWSCQRPQRWTCLPPLGQATHTEPDRGPSCADLPFVVKVTPLGAFNLTSRFAVGWCELYSCFLAAVGKSKLTRRCMVEIFVEQLQASCQRAGPLSDRGIHSRTSLAAFAISEKAGTAMGAGAARSVMLKWASASTFLSPIENDMVPGVLWERIFRRMEDQVDEAYRSKSKQREYSITIKEICIFGSSDQVHVVRVNPTQDIQCKSVLVCSTDDLPVYEL